MSDFTPKMEKRIANLGKLREEVKDLSDQIKAKSEKAMVLEKDIIANVPIGTYQVGKWVLDLVEKISNGRKSTAWAAVGETISGGINIVRDQYIDKNPDDEKLIRRIARRLTKVYNDSYAKNTKPATSSKKTVLNVTRLDN